MKFQVPQFINVEDKIVGPLTLKQFIYLAGGGGLCAVFYLYLPLFLAIFLILPVGIFSAALAFYKINGKPFIEIVEAFFKYSIGKKLYLWKHQQKLVSKVSADDQGMSKVEIPRLSQSKLRDLSWSLDIQDKSKQSNEDDVGGEETMVEDNSAFVVPNNAKAINPKDYLLKEK